MNKFIKRYLVLIKSNILNNKFKYFYYIIKKAKVNKKELLDLLSKIKNDFNFYLEMDPSIVVKEEILKKFPIKEEDIQIGKPVVHPDADPGQFDINHSFSPY